MIRRLNNISLCVRAIVLRLLFPQQCLKEPRRVLIVQMAKLGDMVCTTPMFRAIKNRYPSCEVWVMGNNLNQALLGNNSDVDKYLIFNSLAESLEEIKPLNFDFACTTGPNFEALAMFCLADISIISAPSVENGWSPYETRLYKILRRFVISKPHRMGYYAPREYLRLLEPIGILIEHTKKHLVYSKKAEIAANEFIRDNNLTKEDFIVGITPSAGNKIKQWSAEKFAEVADYLIEKHRAKIIIFGGIGDLAESQEMLLNIKNKEAVFDTAGRLSIDELKSFISKLKLFISVDTGAIYIAEAFGVPTLDIVGPMDEREQPPMGKFHRILSARKLGEKPQLHIMNARVYDRKKAREQIERVTSEMVVKEANSLINLINRS